MSENQVISLLFFFGFVFYFIKLRYSQAFLNFLSLPAIIIIIGLIISNIIIFLSSKQYNILDRIWDRIENIFFLGIIFLILIIISLGYLTAKILYLIIDFYCV
jgi:hypothetical protein